MGWLSCRRRRSTDSPDDVIRRAALRAMGALGDDMAVATLMNVVGAGQAVDVRDAAIASLAQLDKKNEAIESQLIGYLDDPDSTFALPRFWRSASAAIPRPSLRSKPCSSAPTCRWAWRPTSSGRLRG